MRLDFEETKRKAEAGDAEALYNLGNMYAFARGVDHDEERAAHWYRRAAEQGLAPAQFNLGTSCERGRGVPQSDEEAAFTRDVDRILNNAFYNRCMDKTQVFPLRRNGDLTRRSYHLQLVSQTARKIARALRLNEALTEAIALGHDMGHTPFGHSGEDILSDLYRGNTGRYFSHNVHSVRILRTVAGRELSLQTLNGILCHCGETAFREYRPKPCKNFDALDKMMERCARRRSASKKLRPSTLKGCVVRICDILAYLGKDRQDALSIGVLDNASYRVKGNILGETNRDFIANATANIIKNSIGRDHLAMDQEVIDAILAIKRQNGEEIYMSDAAANTKLKKRIRPMMARLYERFLDDLRAGDGSSYIYRHHLKAWWMSAAYREQAEEKPDDTVADYIASMTDDYFIDLFNTLYPEDAVRPEELYVGYFGAGKADGRPENPVPPRRNEVE